MKFINGYVCDDSGKPITQSNGYSSEDERDARELYEETVTDLEKEKETPKPKRKYNKKKEYHKKATKEVKADFARKIYDRNGYMLNEAGQAINLENGYTDDDIASTRREF